MSAIELLVGRHRLLTMATAPVLTEWLSQQRRDFGNRWHSRGQRTMPTLSRQKGWSILLRACRGGWATNFHL